MKVKLLKKLRKRFKFTNVHGYSEMLDNKTGIVYGPEWKYCRSRYSVHEHNVAIAIELLTGGNRFERIEERKMQRCQKRYYQQILNA